MPVILSALLLTLTPLCAQQTGDASAAAGTLVVATKEAPPFAMKMADGSWTGISIDLWRSLAEKLSIDYEFREMDFEAMLREVESGGVNAAIAAITIVPDREKRMDFTHPYYHSGLGLAFAKGRGSGWTAVLRNLFSRQFVSAVLALSMVLMLAAIGVWFFERKENPGQFGGTPVEGLGASFWWSAVTMTTVGYGDKSPQTLGGRLVALIWMFASIIIISGFTAAIASSITVHNLASDLLQSRELNQLRIATVRSSAGALYGEENRLNVSLHDSLNDALQALHAKRADAVLYDIPLLRYSSKQDRARPLEVLPRILVDQAYGIALPPGSTLREPLNVALLETLQTPAWEDLLFRYLGE